MKVEDATILDIGCGAGTYSLPLARLAARVTGLDASAAMLARFEAARAAAGINNAATLHACWKEADIGALGLEKSFDVVWAAMTPAIRDAGDVLKMRRCSRGWCVFIGWGSIRDNALMEEVFAAHGLSYGPPPGASHVRSILAEQGIAVDMELVTAAWDREGTVEEVREEAGGLVEHFGGMARPECIREVVARHAEKGRVRHRTLAEMGVLAWREY